MKYRKIFESKKSLLREIMLWKKTTLLIVALLVVVSLLSLRNSLVFDRAATRAYYAFQSALHKSDRDITIKLNVPFHRQEHALSCEIATLKMVLDYYGLSIAESELISKITFATKEPRDTKNNIWEDPNAGFVGNIDGIMPNTGYGVYEKPITELASLYKNAESFENANLDQILQEVKNLHPVIIWGTTGKIRDISWTTPEGENIPAVLGEHTRVVVGYSGTIEEPQRIYLIDPIYGHISMKKDEFLKDWAHLGNRTVIVY